MSTKFPKKYSATCGLCGATVAGEVPEAEAPTATLEDVKKSWRAHMKAEHQLLDTRPDDAPVHAEYE